MAKHKDEMARFDKIDKVAYEASPPPFLHAHTHMYTARTDCRTAVLFCVFAFERAQPPTLSLSLSAVQLDFENEEHTELLLQVVLHGIDIGNMSLPWPQAVRFGRMLQVEFSKQVAMEEEVRRLVLQCLRFRLKRTRRYCAVMRCAANPWAVTRGGGVVEEKG